MEEHECPYQERFGAWGEWMKQAGETLRDIRDHQAESTVQITAVVTKVENIENYLFKDRSDRSGNQKKQANENGNGTKLILRFGSMSPITKVVGLTGIGALLAELFNTLIKLIQ